jgi:CRP-like cAMP-binding protein
MLAGLCEPLLVRLVQVLRVVDFIPGQLMLEKGQESKGVQWIWTGTFEVLDNFDGVCSVSTLNEGMMLGENCLVKNMPKNCCNIRAMTWCNILMLPMSDIANVFAGYDRDLHWLMCFSEVRWPRFCAAVALSNVLECASREGTSSLRSWIQVCMQICMGTVSMPSMVRLLFHSM